MLSALGRKAYTQCLPLETLHGVHCVEDQMMSMGRDFDNTTSFGVSGHMKSVQEAIKSKIDFFAAGFNKIKLILDALSMGLDVLFLDVDQVFFRNPIPYILQVTLHCLIPIS